MMDRRQFMTQAVAAGVLAAGLPGRIARAAGAPAVDKPFCFAVVADPHSAEEPRAGLEACGTGVDKFLHCARVMEAMAPEEKPDFILLCGDVQPEALRGRLGEVHIPVHATPGNHESDRAKRELVRELFPEDYKIGGKPSDYYSFVHNGVRFISMCDAGKGGEHVGQFCSENIEPSGQCEWLEQELAAPEPEKIVFAHIPPERNGADRNMYMSRNDSRWFNALIEQAAPRALFFGHLHQPLEQYAAGTAQVYLVPSCCWNFAGGKVSFLHVRMSGEGLAVREIETGNAHGPVGL